MTSPDLPQYSFKAHWTDDKRIGVVACVTRPDGGVHLLQTIIDPPAAKPEQQAEPCVGKDPRCPCQDGDACHYKDCGGTKAWPVQRQPLTDEQIKVIHFDLCNTVGSDYKTVARAIEAAHNIKENK